jgi:hypothetical protein
MPRSMDFPVESQRAIVLAAAVAAMILAGLTAVA